MGFASRHCGRKRGVSEWLRPDEFDYCAPRGSIGPTRVPTDGQPGIFATLEVGAPAHCWLYFMYDVKQVDPADGHRRRGTLRS